MAMNSTSGRLVLLMFTGHIAVPLLFILRLILLPQHDLPAWIVSSYTAVGYVALIFFLGAWSWFGKALRYALPALFVLAALVTYPHHHAGLTLSSLTAAGLLISFCVGTTFVAVTVLALLGRRPGVPALKLSFPLRGGTYIIAQGGNSRLVNAHFTQPSQRYALDILKLNTAGLRARGLYPADPKRYAIFGAEVVSPCDGVVAAAEEGCADYSPPDRDSEHHVGNCVVIECDEATIYLAHLMKGSVCVGPGERVCTGQVVGRVGNSGNTTEPHLHIHAEQGSYPGQFSGRPGIAMKFHGRFLTRNDCVDV